MQYDIVIVTQNNEKDVLDFFDSINTCNKDKSKLSLVFVDNSSCDNTVAVLEKMQVASTFYRFEIIKLQTETSLTNAYQAGICVGDFLHILFFSGINSIDKDFFVNTDNFVSTQKANIFLARQMPYERGNNFDPVTLQTKFLNLNGLIINRKIFGAGFVFDAILDDLDFSIYVSALQEKAFYLPKSIFYTNHTTSNPTSKIYIDKCLNSLLLSYKYGYLKDIISANKVFINTLKAPAHYENIRKLLLKKYLLHFLKAFRLLAWKTKNRRLDLKQSFDFFANYIDMGEHFLQPITLLPLVCVIVRTFSRSDMLWCCLKSLENQTYPNFEILVCEDGNTTCAEVIKEFSHLNIKYLCDNTQKGRSANGNLGLENAAGEWCMFLDDDDLVYPNHIECFVAKAEQTPDAQIILGSAFAMYVEDNQELKTRVLNSKLEKMVFDRIDIFTMCQSCRIPIQTAMFKKELYTQCGGLATNLDANEDWAMWLKYLAVARRASVREPDITYITSIFSQPANLQIAQNRLNDYQKYNQAFFNDETICFGATLLQMRQFYDDVLSDIAHLHRTGKLEDFLKKHNK